MTKLKIISFYLLAYLLPFYRVREEGTTERRNWRGNGHSSVKEYRLAMHSGIVEIASNTNNVPVFNKICNERTRSQLVPYFPFFPIFTLNFTSSSPSVLFFYLHIESHSCCTVWNLFAQSFLQHPCNGVSLFLWELLFDKSRTNEWAKSQKEGNL